MIKPKKSLGQNFLIDKNISKKIVNLTNIKNKTIIEIGPGKGFLTDEIISRKPKKLTIIEKDQYLFLKLKEKYRNIKNLEVINHDALKYNYKINLDAKTIISNLPYNISIKLIIKWLKMKNHFAELILMIQKEVAKKMNYNNNLKKNRLNCLIENTSNIFNIEFHVSRNVFIPKPKINSSVIKIIPKNDIKIDLNKFEIFTREIFQHKRKKISKFINSKKINIDDSFDNLIDKRAEDLSNNELLKIFKKFYNS